MVYAKHKNGRDELQTVKQKFINMNANFFLEKATSEYQTNEFEILHFNLFEKEELEYVTSSII